MGGLVKTRFLFLGLFLASTVVAMAAPSPVVVDSGTCSVTVGGAEYDLITIVQDFPAGAGIAAHQHGGNLLVTVITGALTLHESGGDRVVKAGESFTESPGNTHSVVNAGPSQARIAISVLLPKGAELTTMMSVAGKM
jgi:quercetin dioxygenase-like cupin family protein